MTKRAMQVAMAGLVAVPLMAFTFGGWAVVTVVDVPQYATAGTPIEIRYDLRQHGMSLVSGSTGKIEARSGETRVEANALSLANGRYVGTVTLPHTGQWSLRVNSGWGIGGEMLPITVVQKGAPAPASTSPANQGRHLFVAKGCVTCHTHQLTKGFNSVKVAPDLSEPKFVAAYLARFLADPSVKTNWASDQRMPNLALKPAEISSLVAFLNRETHASQR